MDMNIINILIKYNVDMSLLNAKSEKTKMINELELLGMDKDIFTTFLINKIVDKAIV